MSEWLDREKRLFNPAARSSVLPISTGEDCFVVDDAFARPEGLVACAAAAAFHNPDGFPYPGVIAAAPPALTDLLAAYFAQTIRSRLGARRTLSTSLRFSMVTSPPSQLQPVQWQCHRDRLGPATPDLRLAAMIAYLFHDPALGGTSFYRPRQGEIETQTMIEDADRMSAEQFTAHYGIEAGYLSGSNPYFERIAQVPAAWNRMIFYNGDLFHSGDVGPPGRLSSDVATGRLTLNGFFTCRPELR